MTTDEPFYSSDPWLEPFVDTIRKRHNRALMMEDHLTSGSSLKDTANSYQYYGLHRTDNGWMFREWAPNATEIYIIGSFNGWREDSRYGLNKTGREGDWEIIMPENALRHGDLYKLLIKWDRGYGERIPSYANRVVQDNSTKIFSAQVWSPQDTFIWQNDNPVSGTTSPLIYEAHVGMATEDYRIGSYLEFAQKVIPRIVADGYNTIQLMAIQEHPFYGSFGYHVANFFAPSSRFGTPEELKELIDTAHANGLMVIMDLVHSHSVKNINEGLGEFDGPLTPYFHHDSRRIHKAWDSLCFDYGNEKVMRYLLSNCRYWMEEFRFDGFRFDGVTSMIYYDHGLEKNFTDYDEYFNGQQDEDALTYLFLANKMIHQIRPGAITIAEEMSGYPGTAASVGTMGLGFDFRMSMGVPDYWIKLIKEVPDEKWDMGGLFRELTQHRAEEKTISYCESHDQALVGDQTLIFRMLEAEIYTGMNKGTHSVNIDRGIALHKMIRLITFATANSGYLNFIGNEFGHPEWIDFPREGNNWSYQYARRQWSLADNNDLKYEWLGNFDKKMIHLEREHKIIGNTVTNKIYESNNDKIIAFMRGDILFVFNFHPSQSFTGYGIPIQGKFRILFDSDQPEYGGFGRLNEQVTYLSQRHSDHPSLSSPVMLYLYLPSRTAIVLKKIPVHSALDI